MILELLKMLLKKSIYELSPATVSKIKDFKAAQELFSSDYMMYYKNIPITKQNILNEPTLPGILCYRMARAFYEFGDEKSSLVLSNLGRFYSGFEIYYSAKIGHSFKINHGLGTVIGARSVLGDQILMHHNVTIGAIDRKTPVIGDSVKIYPGAKILGGCNIGSNSTIGANSVVIVDIPNNSTVVASKGRVL